MARRKKNNRTDNPFEESRDEDAPRSRRSRTRNNTNRKTRRWPYVLLLLVVLIGLLPNILGWTGLHQTAINYALSDFKGKFTVERASMGWFQPIKLTNVAAVDAQGNDLLKIEQITSSKRLYSFLRSQDYGNFDVQKPIIYLQLRPAGSNFEDALATYLTATPKQPVTAPNHPSAETSLPKLAINVFDGRALITSTSDVRSWQVDNLTATAQTSSADAPLSVEAKCQITPLQPGPNGQVESLAPGSLALNSRLDPGATVLKFGAVELALTTENFPVSLAGPVLQRFVGPAQSAGQLSGSIVSNIDLNQSSMDVTVNNMALQGLQFAAPQLIGADQFQLQNLNAHGSLKITPQLISSSNFEVQSEVGRVKANGRFDMNQLNQLAAGGALLNEPFQMEGQIDLASLIRMLPTTFKLHADLQVDSGTIDFLASTKNDEGQRRLVVNLDTANLKARRGSQNIVWQKPLHLDGSITQVGNRMVIEDLQCESDFLTIAGSATPESGGFRAKGDLSKLMDRISDFVDLAGVDLAGEIDGNFGWQTAATARPADGLPIQIGGSFVIINPAIRLPKMPVWQQPQLSVKLSAAGQSLTNPQTSAMVLRLDTGGVQIDVGPESALATLAAPVQNVFTDPVSLACEINGDLQGWLGHVRNFVDLGDIQAAGALALKCSAALNNNIVQLNQLQYSVNQLAFDGYGMKIRDPQVSGTGELSYDLNTGNILVADVSLVGNSLAARGQNLKVTMTDNLRIDGAIAYRADVNRVADWFELSPTEESVYWFGGAEGNVQLASTENGIGGRLTATITDLVAAQRVPAQPVGQTIQPVSNRTEWAELFRESTAQLESELQLSNDFNAIEFQKLIMKSSALNLTAAGSVSDLAASILMNIQGTWNPDWQKVQSLLGAYTGNLFQLSGSGGQPFSIRGPVFAKTTGPDSRVAWIPAELEAATSVQWDQGSILDVPIGASQLNVDVKNSVGRVTTPGIPFSGGTVQFAPSVDMRGANPVLVMDQTRIVDNVVLTADTARQWLKYVAPLVADATSAQGNFTLDTHSLRLPIFDPLSIEATGTIRLSQVAIGAGPLADQLLGTVTQLRSMLKPDAEPKDLKTWLQMAEQTIPVTIKNQAVYHENVTFTHNDMTVRTSGAVGFNQSLNMLAEIPIADDWIAGKSYLAGLKGQKLSIPISGTVSKPQLDKRALQNLSTDLVKSAAGGALNQAFTDKVAPKAAELQNQFNEKLSGELNKLQGKLGGQIPNLGDLLPGTGGTPSATGTGSTNGLPNFGGFLPGNLGGTGTAPNSAVPNSAVPSGGAPSGGAPVGGNNPAPDLGKQLEGEVLKGIGNLFGGKKK